MDHDWHWPDKAKKKLHPRRGGVDAKFRKIMTARKAFKTLADAYSDDHISKSELKRASPASKKLLAKVSKTAPKVNTADAEAELIRPFFSYAYGTELVDYWLGEAGATFAVQALLATHRQRNYDCEGWYKDTHCVQTAWVRFRQRLSLIEKDAYEAALELGRCALARRAISRSPAARLCVSGGRIVGS